MITFHIPDVSPLILLIVLLFSATAKFYYARRNRSWFSFADAMARIGLAAFYLLNYLAVLKGITSGSDDSRAFARLGILALFLIETIPWLFSFFKREKKS